MTNKLHCPFCGAELENEMALFGGFESETGRMLCSNKKCEWRQQTLEPEVWQALIDGRKARDALKVAIKGIKEIESDNERGLGEGGGLYSDDTPFEELLNQITSITTQELKK